jgi:hypothetical protein
MLFFFGNRGRNRARVLAIRDRAPTSVAALAEMFADAQIIDDGTVHGRLRAILGATEHRLVPGLQTGADIGLTGFRDAYKDPWPSSRDQVGHFLTAVRLAFAPGVVRNPLLRLLAGIRRGDHDVPVRLIVGHEKVADPSGVYGFFPRVAISWLRSVRAQYRSATAADVVNFLGGTLSAIDVGSGLGNSEQDLRLSYQGWLFGKAVAAGEFKTNGDLARWTIETLGPAPSPSASRPPEPVG